MTFEQLCLRICEQAAFEAETDEHWITLNGAHVLINTKTGLVEKGPRHLIGHTPDKVMSHGKPPAEPKPGFIAITRNAAGEYDGADEKVAARLKALRLPPGWRHVHLSSDEKAPLQAVGKDAKGRSQYVYSAEHSAKAAADKFARVKTFVQKLPNIRRRISNDLNAGKNMEEALVLYLVDQTGFRIGSEVNTQAKKQAYGATTLQTRHVKIDGDKVSFDFIGKKGVRIRQTLKDKGLAERLAFRLEKDGNLFNTSDAKVRDYLKSIAGKFKPKDFRTAVAADTAMKAMNDLPAPHNVSAFKKQRLLVGKTVAEKLGNTPTVALASYIPPEVFAPWEANVSA